MHRDTKKCECAVRNFFGVMILFYCYNTLFYTTPIQAQPAALEIGYRSFNYDTTVIGTPTAEKPESKLWWNDGFWWGSLWDPVIDQYTIHRFDAINQSWINTNAAIDNRSRSLSDALWDGQHLYIVSHVFANSGGDASSGEEGRLYRYSYDVSTTTYALEAGFPVIVNNSKSETLVLDKDSSGKLWITWTEGGKVKVNRSIENDQTWGTPFDLPVQGMDVSSDDISAVAAFGGNKTGIMWSNQLQDTTFFAIHLDSDPDTIWQDREVALAGVVLNEEVDDHINFSTACDGSGNLYGLVKTGMGGPNDPGILLLKRDAAGYWTQYEVSKRKDDYTRAIVIVDSENERLFVFAKSERTSHDENIYMKVADLNDLLFPVGLGTPFIQSTVYQKINNPTSTKQCINSTTGLLVLASDEDSTTYVHNFITGDSLRSIEPDSIAPVIPAAFQLHPGYPNPFNSRTTLRFDIPEVSGSLVEVKIAIYNILGQLVKNLYKEQLSAGSYEVYWNGINERGDLAASGIYFAVFTVDGFSQTRKLILLR